jgi:hypothetical protein
MSPWLFKSWRRSPALTELERPSMKKRITSKRKKTFIKELVGSNAGYLSMSERLDEESRDCGAVRRREDT